MVRSAGEAKRRWRAPVQRFPRATPLPKTQRSRQPVRPGDRPMPLSRRCRPIQCSLRHRDRTR
ncbi:hypothetical protein [Azospirillum endophyticum]